MCWALLSAATLLTACDVGSNDAAGGESAGIEWAAREIAAIVTADATFAVTPDSVSRHFASLVTLASGSRSEYVWTFVSEESAKGILWATADFQPAAAEGAWGLMQIQLAVTPSGPTGTRAYQELREAITGRMGPPAYGGESEPDRRLAWSMGEYHEVALQERPAEDPRTGRRTEAVLVEAIVLQGEGEEP
jgi:hypothetical protein